jgi:hypothetical protein
LKKYPLITKYLFTLLVILFCFSTFEGKSQGRVVINEFMPWSLNNCTTNGEFVELMNFGPGPMNIGCYIITNGKYSVTIPPNTILQPGAYYVIGGANSLPINCGNIDSAVQVQLNWHTCNCTNIPVPSTGDGFFVDGGGANEKVILLSPNMEIVDAVTRSIPTTSSDAITTPTINGGCPSRQFDLDTMNVKYEELGMSTGIGNSFARTIDGDCQWVKDTKQSAHATNNRTGDVSAVQYTLNITGARDCGSGGSINIQVNIVDGTVTDYARMFPMNYAIAYDANNDGIYDLVNDVYTYGTDNTPPSIDINGLPMGRYRIVVGSVLGCFLATFNVSVLICEDPLRAQLLNFNWIRTTPQHYTFKWMLTNPELVSSIVLEKSMNGQSYIQAENVPANFNTQTYLSNIIREKDFSYYRLKITGIDGSIIYSNIISTSGQKSGIEENIGPNPVQHLLMVRLMAEEESKITYKIYNTLSAVVGEGQLQVNKGLNQEVISVKHLPIGIYQLVIINKDKKQPISFRFVKQ